MATLAGANRDFVLNRIPHISRLMVDGIGAVLDHAQTLVIGNDDPEFQDALSRLRDDQVVVDFAGIGQARSKNGNYEGICW
jgi:GDP-mannose 6-dehydrogenase